MTRGVARIIRVAVPTPLRSTFDYLAPLEFGPIEPGCRVRVPFGRTTKIGIVVGTDQASNVAPEKLRVALERLDAKPVLHADAMALMKWAGDYYHHPIGEVFASALPSALRLGAAARLQPIVYWQVTPAGRAVDLACLQRAPRQAKLLKLLQSQHFGTAESEIAGWAIPAWRQVLKRLSDQTWVEPVDGRNFTRSESARVAGDVTPNTSQEMAIEEINSGADRFGVFLLDGVTGSGKTEVYLEVIRRVLSQGRAAMVLVPEIGLTPQTVSRFQAGLGVTLGVFHSGLSDQQRLNVWLKARDGDIRVIIGTRSAIWIPLHEPGVFIVDEEHDTSYKQQDGLRYSARDLAIVRANRAKVPVVLGTATPSLESLYNVRQGRYTRIVLPERTAGATLPTVSIVDVRSRPFNDGLSAELLEELQVNLDRGEQSLLFLNRRGFSPSLMCHDCGWVAQCERCDANLVYHTDTDTIRCHHCGAERSKPEQCPECSSKVFARGAGTQRIMQALEERYPAARISRIDRDSTRRKGAFETILGKMHSKQIDILIGTQMLAKGHHFPHVTLVSILDADGGLYGVDFRSSERMAQLLVQVAGRAGRGDCRGRVLIQTHHPDHPMLHALLHNGYSGFAEIAMGERQAASLPPYTNLALLRAEAANVDSVYRFLNNAEATIRLLADKALTLSGPVPAPMEKRAGKFRAQLLLQCDQRGVLHRILRDWLAGIGTDKVARKVRWSLDVDPQDMI